MIEKMVAFFRSLLFTAAGCLAKLAIGLGVLVLVNMGLVQVARHYLDFEPDPTGFILGVSVVLLIFFTVAFQDRTFENMVLNDHKNKNQEDDDDDDEYDFDDDEGDEDKLLEGDNFGKDGRSKTPPREGMFGIIDLVFRGATDAEAAVMAGQFMSQDIFEGSIPSYRPPSFFGRSENEVAVRVIYHRVIHSPDAYNDKNKLYERVKAAYKDLRLSLPDGRSWKIINYDHLIWFSWNRLTYDTTVLLDQVVGTLKKTDSEDSLEEDIIQRAIKQTLEKNSTR